MRSTNKIYWNVDKKTIRVTTGNLIFNRNLVFEEVEGDQLDFRSSDLMLLEEYDEKLGNDEYIDGQAVLCRAGRIYRIDSLYDLFTNHGILLKKLKKLPQRFHGVQYHSFRISPNEYLDSGFEGEFRAGVGITMFVPPDKFEQLKSMIKNKESFFLEFGARLEDRAGIFSGSLPNGQAHFILNNNKNVLISGKKRDEMKTFDRTSPIEISRYLIIHTSLSDTHLLVDPTGYPWDSLDLIKRNRLISPDKRLVEGVLKNLWKQFRRIKLYLIIIVAMLLLTIFSTSN